MLARVREGLRHLGVGTLAGILAGVVVGGAGGRLVMRVSGFLTAPELAGQRTENGNVVGEVTLAGTLAIVLFVGIAAGILGGWLYAALRPSLARARSWRGALYGVLLLALAGSLVIDPQNFDFRRFGPVGLNVAMFAALFLLFGVAIEPLYAWIDAASGSGRSGGPRVAASVLVWLMAIASVLGFAFILAANAVEMLRGTRSVELIGATAFLALCLVLLGVTVATRDRLLKRVSYAILALGLAVAGARTVVGIARVIGGES